MTRKTLICLRAVCILSLTIIAGGPIAAQNTTRKGLKPIIRAPHTDAAATADTIYYPPIDSISLSGYEKAQTSSKETFFVTNHTRSSMTKACITLTYTDTHGAQLHRRSVDVDLDLPPGETRCATVKTWDAHKLWYYTGSQSRHRSDATPFDVSYKVDFYVIKNDAE